MFQKTLLTLAVGAALTACGGDNSSYSNSPGSVAISGFTGSPSVGDVLTASVSDADGVVAQSERYGWYANGAVIEGADASSFTVTDQYIGQTLQVKVSYQGENGLRESVASSVTGAVPASLSISTTFIHGLVEGGSCSLYPLSETGEKGAVLASGMTASGTLSFSGIEYQGPALIECAGGSYVDEATGSSLTAPLSRAVVNVDGDADFVVSPLTELATQLALADAAGLLSALSSYNNDVAQWFGLEYVPAGATDPVIIDITTQAPADLQASAINNDAAGLYATALALVSQLDENTSGDAANLVSALAADLVDGSFSVDTLQDLAAAQMNLASSAVASNLNQDALDAMAISIGIVNTDGMVTIEGSASVGSSLQAVVSDANGVSGGVSYQWRVNGVPMEGATTNTFIVESAQLGDVLSVAVSYIDDSGFSEQLTSADTAAVTSDATNFAGTAGAISGNLLVGDALTVFAPSDANGIGGAVSYQWMADGVDINGATAQAYVLTSTEAGKSLSVTASYTDDDGFAEVVTSQVGDIIFSAIVSNKTELAAAVSAAVAGDVIGLNEGDYANISPAIEVGVAARLTAVAGQAPNFTGTTCIRLGDGAVMEGMTFTGITLLAGSTCVSNGDSSVYLSGTGSVLRNNHFVSSVTGVKFNYVSMKGFQTLIERNSFAGKDSNSEGAYISMYTNTTADSQEGHIIRYNHFRDTVSPSGDIDNRNSSGYAIQLGRSTSTQADGLATVAYNLFSNVKVDQRIIKVQSDRNTIHGNTITASSGQISLEDGYGNTVSSNIILAAGDDKDEGGIAMAQLGHTVVDNYINNLSSSSSKLAALMVWADPLSGSANGNLIGSVNGTLTIARNTVINAKQAIQLGDVDCNLAPTILDMDDNLVANFDSGNAINAGSTNGAGRSVVTQTAFLAKPCTVSASSDFDNNHFYSESMQDSGFFDFKAGVDGNVAGAENGATLTTPNANNMVEGAGADAGIGADLDALIYISDDMVGPGSSWTAN